MTSFCVSNSDQNLNTLIKEGQQIKYITPKWIYITSTPYFISNHINDGSLSDFYFEFAPPALLSDTARAFHFVDDVHAGLGGLQQAYTGKDVIIGFVDTGIELNHPDFLDSQGNTRVLRYWDHTIPASGSSPQPYGYGYVWDSTAINQGLCTSSDSGGHGSTVAGQGSGNGQANGHNKGMAPEADIIVVETNFNLPNWTLTIADACDYIFKVADSLGKPAVINLSLGSYLGSHDGNDPAADYIETLLDEKGGRIVVGAAGNAGNKLGYHVHNDVNADTSFTWFLTNTSSSFGPNTVFFDLWADPTEATWNYSIAVDRPWYAGWTLGGQTIFRGAADNLGTTVYDTIRNSNNDILCTAEIFTEQVYGAYHMQLMLDNCDSSLTDPLYLYRFNATGSGSYDLWSGGWLDLNDIVASVMSPAQYPSIVNYVFADSTQTIVSSWNCSEKVVSVGNMKNRWSHIDRNMNTYVSTDGIPPGKLSINSSKGPNRHNVIKPDITAAGDITLAPAPFTFLNNPVNYSAVDSSGWHARNGGTSMAAPVISGIAALYLERCPYASYQDFLSELQATAYTDGFTGTVPNNAYGYGKAHALNLLLGMNLATQPTISITGSAQISSSSAQQYQWYLDGQPLPNENGQDVAIVQQTGSYQVEIVNASGCVAISDPVVVTLSLNDLQNNHLGVFPNPVTDLLTIDSDESVRKLYLTDISGKQIELNVTQNNTYSIGYLPAGTYYISIETDNMVYHSKLIKL